MKFCSRFIVLFCCKYVSKYQVVLDNVFDNLLTLLSSELCIRVFLLILTLYWLDFAGFFKAASFLL